MAKKKARAKKKKIQAFKKDMGFEGDLETEISPGRNYGSKQVAGDAGGLPSTSFLANAAQHDVIYEEAMEEQLQSLRKPRAAPKLAPLPLLKINTKEVQKLFDKASDPEIDSPVSTTRDHTSNDQQNKQIGPNFTITGTTKKKRTEAKMVDIGQQLEDIKHQKQSLQQQLQDKVASIPSASPSPEKRIGPPKKKKKKFAKKKATAAARAKEEDNLVLNILKQKEQELDDENEEIEFNIFEDKRDTVVEEQPTSDLVMLEKIRQHNQKYEGRKPKKKFAYKAAKE